MTDLAHPSQSELLARSEFLSGMEAEQRDRLLAIAEKRELEPGEYLFKLGGDASHAYVVVEGRIEFCFPLSFGGSIHDVAVESKEAGSTLGWSAFVSPHSFTLSARAAEPSVVAAFPRADLQRVIADDSRLGYAVTSRIATIIGRRLLKIQALWARELQRSIARGEIRSARSGESGAAQRSGGTP